MPGQAQETPVQWSLRTWKQRHEEGYFPNSEQHQNWKVYEAIPDWLADVIPTLGFPLHALEIGCGYGEWMIPLAKSVTRVDGIDIHPSLVNKGGDLFSYHRVKNAWIWLTDGLSIPFPDACFDLVYSISVFQHLPREIVRGYLRESARVVRPQGRVAFHFRDADDVGDYPPLAEDITANHKGDFSCGWTASQIMEAAEEAGLTGELIKLPLFLVFVGGKK